jgi:hypothetical protein
MNFTNRYQLVLRIKHRCIHGIIMHLPHHPHQCIHEFVPNIVNASMVWCLVKSPNSVNILKVDYCTPVAYIVSDIRELAFVIIFKWKKWNY